MNMGEERLERKEIRNESMNGKLVLEKKRRCLQGSDCVLESLKGLHVRQTQLKAASGVDSEGGVAHGKFLQAGEPTHVQLHDLQR